MLFTVSFINIKNKSGPSIEPCGTPADILATDELTPSIETYWILLSLNHDNNSPLMPDDVV